MDLRIPDAPELDFTLLVSSADLIRIGPPMLLRRPAPRTPLWRPWVRRCRQALVARSRRTRTPNRGKWLDRR
jgi:hypothetical protein